MAYLATGFIHKDELRFALTDRSLAGTRRTQDAYNHHSEVLGVASFYGGASSYSPMHVIFDPNEPELQGSSPADRARRSVALQFSNLYGRWSAHNRQLDNLPYDENRPYESRSNKVPWCFCAWSPRVKLRGYATSHGSTIGMIPILDLSDPETAAVADLINGGCADVDPHLRAMSKVTVDGAVIPDRAVYLISRTDSLLCLEELFGGDESFNCSQTHVLASGFRPAVILDVRTRAVGDTSDHLGDFELPILPCPEDFWQDFPTVMLPRHVNPNLKLIDRESDIVTLESRVQDGNTHTPMIRLLYGSFNDSRGRNLYPQTTSEQHVLRGFSSIRASLLTGKPLKDLVRLVNMDYQDLYYEMCHNLGRRLTPAFSLSTSQRLESFKARMGVVRKAMNSKNEPTRQFSRDASASGSSQFLDPLYSRRGLLEMDDEHSDDDILRFPRLLMRTTHFSAPVNRNSRPTVLDPIEASLGATPETVSPWLCLHLTDDLKSLASRSPGSAYLDFRGQEFSTDEHPLPFEIYDGVPFVWVQTTEMAVYMVFVVPATIETGVPHCDGFKTFMPMPWTHAALLTPVRLPMSTQIMKPVAASWPDLDSSLAAKVNATGLSSAIHRGISKMMASVAPYLGIVGGRPRDKVIPASRSLPPNSALSSWCGTDDGSDFLRYRAETEDLGSKLWSYLMGACHPDMKSTLLWERELKPVVEVAEYQPVRRGLYLDLEP